MAPTWANSSSVNGMTPCECQVATDPGAMSRTGVGSRRTDGWSVKDTWATAFRSPVASPGAAAVPAKALLSQLEFVMLCEYLRT